MKKIKTKLVYVNGNNKQINESNKSPSSEYKSQRTINRSDKSPSPDNKTNFKIHHTVSPLN